MEQANATNSSARAVSMGVYAAYLVGALTGIFWLVGLVVAFVYREKVADDSLERRHLDHQVRIGVKLVIAGLAAIVAYLVLVATLIGIVVAWVPLVAWTIWALVVAVKGMAALVGERDPG